MTIDQKLIQDILRCLEIGGHAMLVGEKEGHVYVMPDDDGYHGRVIKSHELTEVADKVRALLEA